MRALLTLLLTCVALSAAAAAVAAPVSSVPELELTRYAGQVWPVEEPRRLAPASER